MHTKYIHLCTLKISKREWFLHIQNYDKVDSWRAQRTMTKVDRVVMTTTTVSTSNESVHWRQLTVQGEAFWWTRFGWELFTVLDFGKKRQIGPKSHFLMQIRIWLSLKIIKLHMYRNTAKTDKCWPHALIWAHLGVQFGVIPRACFWTKKQKLYAAAKKVSITILNYVPPISLEVFEISLASPQKINKWY